MQMTTSQQTEVTAVLAHLHRAEDAYQQLVGKITSWYRGQVFKLTSRKVEVMFASCVEIKPNGHIYVEVAPQDAKGKWSKRCYKVDFADLKAV